MSRKRALAATVPAAVLALLAAAPAHAGPFGWGKKPEAKADAKPAAAAPATEKPQPARKALALAPKDWRAPSLLGVAYQQVDRGPEARQAWEKALALSPENPAVLANLALADAAAGKYAEAEGLLRRAAARPGAGLRVRQNLALVLGMQGKFAEAERLVREDMPPEAAKAHIAWLHAAAGAKAGRSWDALKETSKTN